MEFLFGQVVYYVVLAALYAQYVYTVTFAEAGVAHRRADESRLRHEHYLGDAKVVEVNVLVVEFFQLALFRKGFHLCSVAHQIDDVTFREQHFGSGYALRNGVQYAAAVSFLVAYLKY